MIDAHRRRAARYFATSSKRLLCALKKKLSRGAKSSSARPAASAASTYAMPLASVKAISWTAVEPGLADVIPRDRNRVPIAASPWRSTRRCQRRDAWTGAVGRCRCPARRTPSGCRSGWCRAVCRRATPCSSATSWYSSSNVEAVELIVIEVVTSSSGRSGEQVTHVLERRDRDADLADLTLGSDVVGVKAHLGRQVKGARQSGLTGFEEELEALVRWLRRCRIPRTGAWSRGGPRYIDGWTPRV